MNFVERIFKAQTDEEVELIVKQEVERLNGNQQEEKTLGFLSASKLEKPYRGFIGKNCKIQFSNLSTITYRVQDNTYLYDFVKLFKKYKIKNKSDLVVLLEAYLNDFFGKTVGVDFREDYFSEKLESTVTDDEYFGMIDNFDLSDLKGLGYGMCTERSAMAQNIMTLFGFESYYCMGYFNREDRTEVHCYNIIRIPTGYRLLDYSVPVVQYNATTERQVPFMADLTNDEFHKYMTEEVSMTFEDYEIEYVNGENIKRPLQNRTYTNGKEPEVSKKM